MNQLIPIFLAPSNRPCKQRTESLCGVNSSCLAASEALTMLLDASANESNISSDLFFGLGDEAFFAI